MLKEIESPPEYPDKLVPLKSREKELKEPKYFKVCTRVVDSFVPPSADAFLAESEEDAIKKKKLELGKSFLENNNCEFKCEKISKKDYNLLRLHRRIEGKYAEK